MPKAKRTGRAAKAKKPGKRGTIESTYNAMIGASPGMAGYASATVRPHEEGSRTTRYRQTMVADLMLRFAKYVAAAQRLNATGVASAKLAVYKRMRPGRKTAWDTKPVAHKELLRQRVRAGFITRKAADLSDDVDEIIDPLHPLVRLLQDANPIMNGFVLLEQTQFGLGLAGDAYWHVVAGPDGVPSELWPLPPQFMRPLPSRETIVSGYVYGRGTEVETELSAAEVIRFTQTNPKGDPFRGCGDVEICIDDADLSVAFSQFRLNTLDNGAQPGLILIDKKGGIEQRAQLEEALNRKFGGLAKVGRSLVLTGDIEIQPWSMAEKETAFLASDTAVRETIANCHQIPVALLTLDSAALATAKAAVPQWQMMALVPRVNRIADTINQRLCPLFGDDLYVCFEEVVDKDYDAAAVRVVSLKNSRIITQNEARAELGYDAVPGGDEFDDLPDPFGLGTGGEEGSGEDSEGVGGGDSDDDAEGEDKEPEEDDKAQKRHVPALRPVGTQTHKRTEGPTPEPISQRSLLLRGEAPSCCPHHPRNIRKQAGADVISMTERQLEALVRSWFDALVPKLVPELNEKGLTSESQGVIASTLHTTIQGPLSRIFLHGWNFGVQELGPARGGAELMAALTGPAANYLKTYEGKLVKSVSSTVDEQIRADLAEGIERGESITNLTNRLRESVNGMSGISAERIARTETSRAFQVSRIGSWKESGNVWGKKWLLAPDACEFCEAAAAEYGVQPIDEPFFVKGTVLTGTQGGTMKLDYADVEAANLHPNDRCDIVMVMEPPT